MPQFPGGEKARIKYLDENIVYPIEARRKGIQGKVFVTFIVERDGSVSNVRLLRGIGGGCNEEAIRVIENMPKWIPGIQKGKPVRVQFNIPIIFKLNNNVYSNFVPDIEYNKGIQQMNNGFYNNAIKHFTNSIDKQGPNYKIAYANRGVCKYHLGDFEYAIDDIHKAQSLNARLNNDYIAIVLFNIANEYVNQGKYGEALELYKEAMKLKPKDADTYYNRGIAYYYLGHKEKACKDWKKARKYGSKNVEDLIEERCK